MPPVASDELLRFYLQAKACVVAAGYASDVDWAESVRLDAVTETGFLSEVLFVALNSGMRATVVRAKWPAIRAAFGELRSAADVVRGASLYVALAKVHFASEPKLRSVVEAARRVEAAGGWPAYREVLRASPEVAIAGLPFIGPVTRWHLLRNLGADVAKPDRHLVRLAARFGWEDVQAFCTAVGAALGDRVGVVDYVFWRHAERQCRCTEEEGT